MRENTACTHAHSHTHTHTYIHKNLPGSCIHGILQEYQVGSQSLLQRIFPTQGSNLGLLHCRRILYHLSHQGSPSKALAACKGPIDHNLSSRVPSVHTGHTDFCLGTHGPCGPPWPDWHRKPGLPVFVLSGQSHCHHLGLLFISGCVPPFWSYLCY